LILATTPVLWVLITATVGRGQQIDAELKSHVLEWIDQLDAPSLSVRKAAEQSLIEVGPAALPFFPETKRDASVEATERLTRVRRVLTSQQSKQRVEAEQVVIRLADVSTLQDAFEAISRDSGVEFEYDGDQSIKIVPTPALLSFWHALDLVLDQANLDINFYGGDRNSLKIVQRAEHRPSRVDSAAYSGIYRIEPTLVTSRRHLSQPALSGLNVNVEISWEPRLTPIGLTIPVQQLSGRLDNDEPLSPQVSGDTIDVATNSDIAFSEFYLPMQLPAGQPEKIESLSGLIRALMPGPQAKFELPLTQKSPTQTIDSMTVRVEDVRANGPLHQIRISVELANADRSLESHRHWLFENQIYVKRPDGSRADHLGYEVYRQTSSGVGVGYLFDLGESVGESTLIYQSPTAVIPNEVSFSIQDVPLP
jgi:hypothetical protein